MRFFLAIILLTLTTLQVFAPFLVVTLFYTNQKSIAEKYCINKSRPKMHCNGKCYLSKKLNQLNQTDNTNGDQKEGLTFKIKSDPFTIQLTYQPQIILVAKKNDFGVHQNHLLKSPLCPGVFRPPCAVV